MEKADPELRGPEAVSFKKEKLGGEAPGCSQDEVQPPHSRPFGGYRKMERGPACRGREALAGFGGRAQRERLRGGENAGKKGREFVGREKLAGEKARPQRVPGMLGEAPGGFHSWTCEEEATPKKPRALGSWEGVLRRGGTSVGKVDLEAGRGEKRRSAGRSEPSRRELGGNGLSEASSRRGRGGGCDSASSRRGSPTWVPRAVGGGEELRARKGGGGPRRAKG